MKLRERESSSLETKFIEEHFDYLKKIDLSIEETLERYSDHPLFGPMSYSLKGGKRLRPLICLLVNEGLGRRVDPLPAATALELLHTVSLIHDDFIDRATVRRGVAPYYQAFGVESAFLAADYVLGLILKIGSSYEERAVGDELAQTAVNMAHGEEEERRLLAAGRKVSVEEYQYVLRLKTASLFGASASIGALLSSKKGSAPSMARFGERIGMAYQIRDDLLDMEKERELVSLLEPADKKGFLDARATEYISQATEEMRGFPEGPAVEKLRRLLSDYF